MHFIRLICACSFSCCHRVEPSRAEPLSHSAFQTLNLLVQTILFSLNKSIDCNSIGTAETRPTYLPTSHYLVSAPLIGLDFFCSKKLFRCATTRLFQHLPVRFGLVPRIRSIKQTDTYKSLDNDFLHSARLVSSRLGLVVVIA